MSAADDFKPVTREQPCAICGKHDWCRRSARGAHECHRVNVPAADGYERIAVTPAGFAVYRRPEERCPRRPSSQVGDIKHRRPRIYESPKSAAGAFARWKHGTVEAVYQWTADWFRARVRTAGGKVFCEITRDAAGWVLRGPAKPHPLYRAARLPSEGIVFVCEGEKACDAGWSIGLPCVTSGAANSASSADWGVLRGRDVAILPDRDDAGGRYAVEVAQRLAALEPPASAKIIELPGLGKAEDLHDFIAEHGDSRDADELRSEILRLVDAAAPLDLARPSGRGLPVDDPWPAPLAPCAYHGLAGKFVRLIEPHTEADPAALLIQFLICFGNAIGRRSHQTVEADRHYTNLFAVLIGRTSKGRKGSSLGRVLSIFETIDEPWVKRMATGLSSGEGLIYAVRDPVTQQRPIKEGKGANRQIVGYEDVVVDGGEEDKRLLVVEAEFASVLRVIARETNTLSPIVRQAWDRGNLRTLTKNSPVRATGAHISIIGHATRDDVRRHIAVTELANGFCNRFLWVCVRRSKLLPEGGRLKDVDFGPFLHRLAQAYDHAQQIKEMSRDDAARRLWAEIYPELSEGRAGLLGAATSRAEAQVLRLSALFALLDLSAGIRTEHLRAALELWRYCEESARYVFGSALGDPLADEIHRLLCRTPAGMTRTELRDAFGRHKGGADFDRSLGLLAREGVARCERSETGGRPEERWFAVARPNDKSDKSDESPAPDPPLVLP